MTQRALLLLLPAVLGLAPPTPVALTVDSSRALLTLPPSYLGFTLDWWPPWQENFGTSTVNLIDLTHPRLVGLVGALGPTTLRLGGSLDSVIRWTPTTPADPDACTVHFRGADIPNLCLNATRWEQVLAFVAGGGMARGSQLVFGLPLNLSSGGAGPWEGANVLAFLAATAPLPNSSVIAAFEVGEETNPAPGTAGFLAQVGAYAGVRAAVGALWAPPRAPPAVLGPCSGMNENVPPFNWTLAFAAAAAPSLGGWCLHSYNNDGGGGWGAPGFLAQTAAQVAGVRGALDVAGHAALPLWCGECGPHNGGGLKNVTDRAISSFWYTDALHELPRLGAVAGFNRQTLAGGNYGLLSNDDFSPRPDYFAALAFARLGGGSVLAAAASPNVTGQMRAFAACARSGGLAVAWVNVDPAAAFSLAVAAAPGGLGARKLEYHFAPQGGDPLAPTLTLNGVALVVEGVSPPPFVGAPGDAAQPTLVAPWTWGYTVFPDAPCGGESPAAG